MKKYINPAFSIKFKMEQKREHLYTQKLFPTINNDDLLEFRVPPNQKGQLDLSNVLLHFVQMSYFVHT